MSWKVVFEDEDGKHTNYHNSYKEAMNWIRAQEARVSSGEEFELIDGPTEVNKLNFSDRLRKCFVCYIPPPLMDGNGMGRIKFVEKSDSSNINSSSANDLPPPKFDKIDRLTDDELTRKYNKSYKFDKLENPHNDPLINRYNKELELNKPKDPNVQTKSKESESSGLSDNHKKALAAGAVGLAAGTGALIYMNKKKKKYV